MSGYGLRKCSNLAENKEWAHMRLCVGQTKDLKEHEERSGPRIDAGTKVAPPRWASVCSSTPDPTPPPKLLLPSVVPILPCCPRRQPRQAITPATIPCRKSKARLMEPPSALVAHALSPTDTCRICSAPAEPDQPLFHPCKCSGTIRYIHQDW